MSHEKLLILSSDMEMRNSLSLALDKEGFQVIKAPTASEILDILKTHPDLSVILADITLIDENQNLLKMIHTIHEWVTVNPRLSVILTVKEAQRDVALEAVKYAVYDFIVSPFSIKMLLPILRRACERSRLLSGAYQESDSTLKSRVGKDVHTLNNKLTTIIGSLEILRIHQPDMNEKALRLLDTIQRNIREIHSIIEQLNHYAAKTEVNISNTPVEKQENTVSPTPSQTQGSWVARLLMVDDDPDIVILADALGTLGYQVITADNGVEALQALETGKYNLIISDINMPVMDGKLFFQHIAENQPEISKKIVFMTGDNSSNETRQFLASSGRLWLKKPFSFSDLKQMIQKALAQA